MKKLILITLSIFSLTSFANDLDRQLRKVLKENSLKPLTFRPNVRTPLSQLGARLFADTELSGNRDISCMTCHHPSLGTSDELPLSIGVGGEGIGRERKLHDAPIIPRHSPHVFNLSAKENTFMFWDGSVHYDPKSRVFQTPEPKLNGANPQLKNYTKALSSALAAQAMFPPLSHEEMRGPKGTNRVADAKTNVEAWEILTERIVTNPRYRKLLMEAFGDDLEKLNFAHLAEAIAEFQMNLFFIRNTAFDEYVAGNDNAMDDSQKRGAVLFFGKARCFQCHQGMNFTDNSFHNTGFPQIGPGKEANRDDKGLYYTTKKPEDMYKFKTPGLRNVVYTAPYGHSGSLKTLEQVVDHYSHPMRSNHHYNPGFRNLPYELELQVTQMNERLKKVDPIIGFRGIPMTPQDKKDLVNFLKAISL